MPGFYFLYSYNLCGVDDDVAGGGDDEEEVGEVDQPGLVQGDRGGGQRLAVFRIITVDDENLYL